MRTVFLKNCAHSAAEQASDSTKPLPQIPKKLALLPLLLSLSSCTTAPSPPHASATLPVQAAAAEKTTTKTFPTAVDNQAISTDGMGIYDAQHEPMRGNGAGDLVLLIAETGDKLLRKRSLLVDLSLTGSDGQVNDLTCNEILQQDGPFQFRHAELTRFIRQSRSPESLRWQVFGIMNNVSGNLESDNLQLPNFGLISTTPRGKNAALDSQQLHQSRALRADLIIRNNRYGIEENQSLQSVAGEPSAFDPALHSHLSNGTTSMGQLNRRLALTAYRLQLNTQNEFAMQQQTIGAMRLDYRQKTGAVLSFKP